MAIKIFQVDAFTNKLFGGNPAAVCIIEEAINPLDMQSIAFENNLAETAFISMIDDSNYSIRWFTPTVEVDLCGHATLASAHVLFEHLGFKSPTIQFHSINSGVLTVNRDHEELTLDFPADSVIACPIPDGLEKAFNFEPFECFKGKTDYVLLFEDEAIIKQIDPDFQIIKNHGERGVIITAPGDNCDFVSRFFAPQAGINEDPVTGSAHTTLTPLWSKKLNKTKLSARQVSQRGGTLSCSLKGDRVLISGKAVTYLEGTISI